ncbi:MAG: roadblock/LC7 domain-containing protein [Myxococcota bacterium]|nr:roadblock/LC7 domain-containing protein [Myxococcota bacterium]
MFEQTLAELVDAVDGALMSTVIGYDGIDLGRAMTPKVKGQTDSLVVETAALMNRMRQVAEQLRMGAVKELALEAEALTLVLRPVDERFVLALALEPEGNLGMARYQLAVKAPELRRALAS